MHAKPPEEPSANLEPETEYETQGLLSPELAQEWVEEIRRREAERPDLAVTIDGETAFALARALLRPPYDIKKASVTPNWVEEIKRRRADPAQTMPIDAEAAFDEIDALLDRLHAQGNPPD
jgi:hypothetical protein